MTEAEWTLCLDPEMMVDHLKGRVSDRKLRLFAAACGRRGWRLFTEWELSENIAISERFADGEIDPKTVGAIRSQLGTRGGISSRWAASNIVHAVLCKNADQAARKAAHYSAFLVQLSILEMSSSNVERFKPAGDAARTAERGEQADLLRDIIGNPFHPARFNQSWRTPKVVQLAQEMYDQREFCMWLLSDALEEAGCAEPAVLSHCRGLGKHVRGCWLVDAILGKDGIGSTG